MSSYYRLVDLAWVYIDGVKRKLKVSISFRNETLSISFLCSSRYVRPEEILQEQWTPYKDTPASSVESVKEIYNKISPTYTITDDELPDIMRILYSLPHMQYGVSWDQIKKDFSSVDVGEFLKIIQ